MLASASPMDVQTLRDRAEAMYPEFLDVLETMVNVDCGSYSPEGVNQIADMCERRFLDHGWEVDRRPHDGEPRLGDLLIGTLRGAGGPNVLLVGHMDTVFDDGTASERPFTVDGDIARGPGVSDMKAGLLTGFFATHVLQDSASMPSGRSRTSATRTRRSAPPTRGRSSGSSLPRTTPPWCSRERARTATSSPRGRGSRTSRSRSRGGRRTPGVEPEKGRNAVLQAAHTILALEGLNGRWPGVTSNVGVVRGGTRSNVVAERCELQVDLRSPELATLEEAEAEVAADLRRRDRPRRAASRSTPTAGIVRWRRARAGGASSRSPSAPPRSSGSSCTMPRPAAPPTRTRRAAAGTPTIDGLGPVGGDDHGPAEWVDLSSIVPSDGPARGDHLEAVIGMTGWPSQELHPDAYRKLVEGTPAILYIDRPDELSTNLYTSPQIVELLGYSVQEWMEDAELWVRSIHPEDPRAGGAGAPRHERPMRNGSSPSIGSSRRRAARCGSATRRCRRRPRTARSCTGAA